MAPQQSKSLLRVDSRSGEIERELLKLNEGTRAEGVGVKKETGQKKEEKKDGGSSTQVLAQGRKAWGERRKWGRGQSHNRPMKCELVSQSISSLVGGRDR